MAAAVLGDEWTELESAAPVSVWRNYALCFDVAARVSGGRACCYRQCLRGTCLPSHGNEKRKLMAVAALGNRPGWSFTWVILWRNHAVCIDIIAAAHDTIINAQVVIVYPAAGMREGSHSYGYIW